MRSETKALAPMCGYHAAATDLYLLFSKGTTIRCSSTGGYIFGWRSNRRLLAGREREGLVILVLGQERASLVST